MTKYGPGESAVWIAAFSDKILIDVYSEQVNYDCFECARNKDGEGLIQQLQNYEPGESACKKEKMQRVTNNEGPADTNTDRPTTSILKDILYVG